jgi:hypothetical protein
MIARSVAAAIPSLGHGRPAGRRVRSPPPSTTIPAAYQAARGSGNIDREPARGRSAGPRLGPRPGCRAHNWRHSRSHVEASSFRRSSHFSIVVSFHSKLNRGAATQATARGGIAEQEGQIMDEMRAARARRRPTDE